MEIVESESFAQAIAASREHFPRIDGIIEGWKWRLRHKPEQGYPIPGTNPQKYVVKSFPYKECGVPAVRVLYRIVDGTIHLESVHVE